MEEIMLDKKKIKYMTRCAIYEKEIGKEDLKKTGYCASDYVRVRIWTTVIGVTISVIVCALLYFLCSTDDFISNMFSYDYTAFFRKVLFWYIVIALVYIIICIVLYSYRYTRASKRVKQYSRMLDAIRKRAIENEKEDSQEDSRDE